MTQTKNAIDFITTYCPHIGSFSMVVDIGDVFEFLDQVALEIDASPDTVVFPGRMKKHVAYAIATVARYPFLSSPSVMASAYLLTRFEYYFRILSGALNSDGTWKGSAVPDHISIMFPKINKKSISSVSMAYQIMKLNTSLKISSIFNQLDARLVPSKPSKITDIGKRIEWMRHPTAHGSLGDPSSEAIFYGLVTAIVFYNQNCT